jgi:hypothetical protein
MAMRVHTVIIQIMSGSRKEVDRIHHGDTRHKGLNLLIDTVNLVTLREERRMLVVPHVGNVCFITFSF